MTASPQYIRPLVIRHVENEFPIGDVDGINQTFVTAYKFYTDHVKVYLNGLKLTPGISNDYTIINDQTFLMNYAPETGDVLTVDYLRFGP